MEVIIVTGANRGIGLALTKALLADENVVIAGCRRPDESGELRQLTFSYPDPLDLIKCDLEHEEDLAAEADTLLKRRRKLDVIVNNAGIMPEEGSESILNIDGSISTRKGHDHYAYSASKAALNMLTRTVADELALRGVTTVAISPGWVRTEMGGEKAPLSLEESAQSLAETIRKKLDRNPTASSWTAMERKGCIFGKFIVLVLVLVLDGRVS